MSYERSCLDHPTTSKLPLQRTSGGHVQPEQRRAPAGHRGEQHEQHPRHPAGGRHVDDHGPRKPRAGNHHPGVVHRVHHSPDQVIRNTTPHAGEQGLVHLIGIQHGHGSGTPERPESGALARARQSPDDDQFAGPHPKLRGGTALRGPARQGLPVFSARPEPAPRAHFVLTLRGTCKSTVRIPGRETAVRTARPLNGPSGGHPPTRGKPRCLSRPTPSTGGAVSPHRGPPTRHTGILAGTARRARA